MASLSTASTKDTIGGSSDTASTSYHAYPDMTAEQEYFLYELETTDANSIGLVLRAIYDTGDVHKFSRALEQTIARYDKDILRVCTSHYQGFIDSMRQLKNLQDKCLEIKKLAEDVDSQLQFKSEELVKKTAEVVHYRKLQRNANSAIEQITLCLPVLELYAKLEELRRQKKYYQALKVLEELEHTYGSQLHRYRFMQKLATSMEPIREEIRHSSYEELRCFLEDMAKIWQKIGERATKQTAIENGFYKVDKRPSDLESIKSAHDEIQIGKDGTIMKPSGRHPSAKLKSSSEMPEFAGSVTDNIDFAPIHRCCQILTVLNDKEKFETYYREERKKQVEGIIAVSNKSGSIKSNVAYLDRIVGFFIVEDHIMNSQPGLVTRAYKDSLWQLALNSITSTMDEQFGKCLDAEMMIKMKKVILLFALTMKSYGYDIKPVYQVLQAFRDQYNVILTEQYCAAFNNCLKTDDFTPITAETEAQYKEVLADYPQYKRLADREDYPRKLPFSRFVPSVFRLARGFVVGCMRFMEDLQMLQSEVDDTVRRSTNFYLLRCSKSLKEFVADRTCSLIQLIQITINVGYLERSCEFLDRFIMEQTRRTEGSQTVAIKEEVFRDARSEAEQLIDRKLMDKVAEFMDLASYDWELPESSGVASDYITDLINFLKTTFLSFTQLPAVLARHVCIQTCKYIANRLHGMLLSPDVKAISQEALSQFDLDIIQCELFTTQCPVEGFDGTTLTMTFAQLRQLMDLVLNSDWTTYMAERKQPNANGKYSWVPAAHASSLLEKIVECEKKKSGFFSRGSDRKKLYDSILRQLKTLS